MSANAQFVRRRPQTTKRILSIHKKSSNASTLGLKKAPSVLTSIQQQDVSYNEAALMRTQ